jgi:AbrB family looped-hinge helix DNA binding protein
MGFYMHDEKFYGTGTVGEKGQIVIPIKAREALNIKAGDNFIFFSHTDKSPVIHLIKTTELNKFLEKMTEKAINLKNLIEKEEKDVRKF